MQSTRSTLAAAVFMMATCVAGASATCPCTITCPGGVTRTFDVPSTDECTLAALAYDVSGMCTGTCPLPKPTKPTTTALSGGAIAGILIGVLLLLDCIAGGVYYMMQKNKQQTNDVENQQWAAPANGGAIVAFQPALPPGQSSAAPGAWSFAEKALAIASVCVLGVVLITWGAASKREIGDTLSRHADGDIFLFYRPDCDPALRHVRNAENCTSAPYAGGALAGIVLGSLLLDAGVMLGIFKLWIGRRGAALPGSTGSLRAKAVAVANVAVLGLFTVIWSATSTRERGDRVSTTSKVVYIPGCAPNGDDKLDCTSDPYSAGAKAGIVLGVLVLVASLALAAKLWTGRGQQRSDAATATAADNQARQQKGLPVMVSNPSYSPSSASPSAPTIRATSGAALSGTGRYYLCVFAGGVSYRNSPAMEDRCGGTRKALLAAAARGIHDQACEKDEVVEAAEVSPDGAWIRAKGNGKWLPVVSKRGEVLFRAVANGAATGPPVV